MDPPSVATGWGEPCLQFINRAPCCTPEAIAAPANKTATPEPEVTERLVPLCPETPARCVAWIEGYWGRTASLGPPGFESEGPLSVREVVGLVEEGDTPHIKVAE